MRRHSSPGHDHADSELFRACRRVPRDRINRFARTIAFGASLHIRLQLVLRYIRASRRLPLGDGTSSDALKAVKVIKVFGLLVGITRRARGFELARRSPSRTF